MSEQQSNLKWTKALFGSATALSIYGLTKWNKKENWTFWGAVGSAIAGGIGFPLVEPLIREIMNGIKNIPLSVPIKPQIEWPTPKQSDNLLEQIQEKMNAHPTSILSSPDEEQWESILIPGSVILIIGKKGSGKSATGYLILGYLHWKQQCFVLALPSRVHHLLPNHIGVTDDLAAAPFDSAILLDEASLFWGARETMKQGHKTLLEAIVLARQKSQTLIFVTQDTGYIDKNILRAVDTLIVKEPAPLQEQFDRPEISSIIKEAREVLVGCDGDKRGLAYIAFSPGGYKGVLRTPKPGFWTEELSRAFATPSLQTAAKEGKPLTREEIKQEARLLRKQGLSIRKIARRVGIGKSTVCNLLNED